MTLRRLAVLTALLPLLIPAPRAAAEPERRSLVFLATGVSFEQLMAVPEIRSLARSGGAALMSPRTAPGDQGWGSLVTLGAGARSAVSERILAFKATTGFVRLKDIRRITDENEGRSIPGLLGSVLRGHGLSSCVAPGGTAVFVGMNRTGRAALAGRRPDRCALVVSSGLPTKESVASMVRSQAGGTSTVQVIVVEAAPSGDMIRAKDELTPIVMAEGDPRTLFGSTGPMRTLTSDTTRRVGLVSNEDVAPTILRFFGIGVPSEMNGSAIRVSDDPPPFRLHQRHLENRRMTVPVQAGAGIAVVTLGLYALSLVGLRRRLPDALLRASAVVPLLVPPLAVALLAAGSLPELTYAWVIPFLVLATLAGGVLPLAFRRFGVLVPAAAIGAAVLGFFVVEALRGWPDTLFPLQGGSALDGARFYGLPNAEIGLLLGAGLWVAASLSPWAGFSLLVGVGLFAGFPDLGANLGAAVTLFTAAGLWLALRTRDRLGWRGVAITILTVTAGTGAVLAANAILASTPTHGTRFVENAPGRGLGGLWHLLVSRLAVGWRLALHVPLVWIPVLGLFVILWLVLRPPSALRPGFARWPQWRTAILVAVVASMVAYVANDSGPAAAGLGFGVSLAGIFYLPLMEPAETRESPRPEPARVPG